MLFRSEATKNILRLRKGRDVIILGATNVGKSTFVNQMIQLLSDSSKDWITTSHFPGTTLDVIEIPLDDQTGIFDTPGIVNEHQYAHYVGAKTLSSLLPKKEIKPIVNQLNAGQTLFYGGFARMDFLEGEKNSFVSYLPSGIKIHRTKSENADNLMQSHKGTLLAPPTKEELEQLLPFEKHTFVTKTDDVDFVISEIGRAHV